jgi:hypothetical protein
MVTDMIMLRRTICLVSPNEAFAADKASMLM